MCIRHRLAMFSLCIGFTFFSQTASALNQRCQDAELATEVHPDTLRHLIAHPLLTDSDFAEYSADDTYLLLPKGSRSWLPTAVGETALVTHSEKESLVATLVFSSYEPVETFNSLFLDVLIFRVDGVIGSMDQDDWFLELHRQAGSTDEPRTELWPIPIARAHSGSPQAGESSVEISIDSERMRDEVLMFDTNGLIANFIGARFPLPDAWTNKDSLRAEAFYVVETQRDTDTETRQLHFAYGSDTDVQLKHEYCSNQVSNDWLEHPKQIYRIWPASFPPASSAELNIDFTEAIATVKELEFEYLNPGQSKEDTKNKDSGCQNTGTPATSAGFLLSALGFLAIRRRRSA